MGIVSQLGKALPESPVPMITVGKVSTQYLETVLRRCRDRKVWSIDPRCPQYWGRLLLKKPQCFLRMPLYMMRQKSFLWTQSSLSIHWRRYPSSVCTTVLLFAAFPWIFIPVLYQVLRRCFFFRSVIVSVIIKWDGSQDDASQLRALFIELDWNPATRMYKTWGWRNNKATDSNSPVLRC